MAARANNAFWEPVRFVIVGVLNTLVTISIIFGAKFYFSLGDVIANALGYAVGLTVSFALNKLWTFNHSGAVWKAGVRFLVAFMISYSVNLAVILALIGWFYVDSYLAQAIGAVHYTACFYLLGKFVVFRSSSREIPVDR